MVKALINIDNETNRTINIIKAEFGLKDKSMAIMVMAKQYKDMIFLPKLKPSFVRKMKMIQREKTIKIGNMEDFRKRYNIR
jgi:hypothetical protein